MHFRFNESLLKYILLEPIELNVASENSFIGMTTFVQDKLYSM